MPSPMKVLAAAIHDRPLGSLVYLGFIGFLSALAYIYHRRIRDTVFTGHRPKLKALVAIAIVGFGLLVLGLLVIGL